MENFYDFVNEVGEEVPNIRQQRILYRVILNDCSPTSRKNLM
jgi:hypothetical protein